jgi:hypothetical protein
MNTTEYLRSDNAKTMFEDKETYVLMSFREADTHAFRVKVDCQHLDWQVSSVAQICNALGQVFSAVEHLILGSFSNVKTLRVEDGLVEKPSDCLRLEDGELPLELLFDLQELKYLGGRATGETFTSFIDAHQNAGRL